jgi:hypothetical protein
MDAILIGCSSNKFGEGMLTTFAPFNYKTLIKDVMERRNARSFISYDILIYVSMYQIYEIYCWRHDYGQNVRVSGFVFYTRPQY